MKRSEPEETAGPRPDTESQTDVVDHERLARLVAVKRMPPPSATSSPVSASQKISYARLLAFAVIFGGLVLAAIYFMTQRQSVPNLNTQGGSNTQPNSTPENPQNPQIKSERVAIPGGTFMMGREDGAAQEKPSHLVKVRGFFMDNTEVTNVEYAEFVRETSHQPPADWPGNKPDPEAELLPVVNVSYDDAVKFAEWRSRRESRPYRLPTEEEWEYAARGGDAGNLYPWGNVWTPGYAGTKDSGATHSVPVGSYPNDKGRWGLFDMAGNVYEWTSSKASLYSGNPSQIGSEHKDWIIVRGGSYMTDHKQKSPTTYRDWFPGSTKSLLIGFRLVRDTQ